MLPSAFGVLMIVAAAYGADGAVLAVPAAALVAVVAGEWLRQAATGAVLLTVLAVMLADPAPMFTALAGLAATAYLVLQRGAGSATAPTMFGAVGFAVAGAVAIAVPVEVAWLPLAAPLALLAGYLLALKPFLAGTGPSQVSTR